MPESAGSYSSAHNRAISTSCRRSRQHTPRTCWLWKTFYIPHYITFQNLPCLSVEQIKKISILLRRRHPVDQWQQASASTSPFWQCINPRPHRHQANVWFRRKCSIWNVLRVTCETSKKMSRREHVSCINFLMRLLIAKYKFGTSGVSWRHVRNFR